MSNFCRNWAYYFLGGGGGGGGRAGVIWSRWASRVIVNWLRNARSETILPGAAQIKIVTMDRVMSSRPRATSVPSKDTGAAKSSWPNCDMLQKLLLRVFTVGQLQLYWTLVSNNSNDAAPVSQLSSRCREALLCELSVSLPLVYKKSPDKRCRWERHNRRGFKAATPERLVWLTSPDRYVLSVRGLHGESP